MGGGQETDREVGKWGEGGGEVVVVVVMGKADELEKGRRGLCNNAIERPEMQAEKNFLVKEDWLGVWPVKMGGGVGWGSDRSIYPPPIHYPPTIHCPAPIHAPPAHRYQPSDWRSHSQHGGARRRSTAPLQPPAPVYNTWRRASVHNIGAARRRRLRRLHRSMRRRPAGPDAGRLARGTRLRGAANRRFDRCRRRLSIETLELN